MADAPQKSERGDSTLVMYFVAPLAVAAFAWVVDVIFGSAFLVFGSYGLERFAVVTIAVCVIEMIVAAVMFGRARRLVPFAALVLYLVVVMTVALRIGSFQT
jgi:hypothetical protein